MECGGGGGGEGAERTAGGVEEGEAGVAVQGAAAAQVDGCEDTEWAEEVVEAGGCHVCRRPLHADSRE